MNRPADTPTATPILTAVETSTWPPTKYTSPPSTTTPNTNLATSDGDSFGGRQRIRIGFATPTGFGSTIVVMVIPLERLVATYTNAKGCRRLAPTGTPRLIYGLESARPARGQLVGQEASMLSAAVWASSSPLTSDVASDQKVPDPTSLGIWSEASKAAGEALARTSRNPCSSGEYRLGSAFRFADKNPDASAPPWSSFWLRWRASAYSREPKYCMTAHTSGASRNAAGLVPATSTGWLEASADGK